MENLRSNDDFVKAIDKKQVGEYQLNIDTDQQVWMHFSVLRELTNEVTETLAIIYEKLQSTGKVPEGEGMGEEKQKKY